ncbi:hypothetical protein, partial [Rhodococcus pyridinivorans]|uniref:hypothetical protein n=1 Tax=Rhodococcus pyridinivorans TaxID=103816 RepID=UPI0026580DB0
GEKALAAAQQQLAGDRKLMEWLTAEAAWRIDRAKATQQAANRRDQNSHKAAQFLMKHVEKLKLPPQEQETLQKVAAFVTPKGNETSRKTVNDKGFGY